MESIPRKDAALVRATAVALDAAVKAADWPSYLRFETEAVRLHRLFGGHHPSNGRRLDLEARAELKAGHPGQGCQEFADYLAAMTPAPRPTKQSPTKGKE